MINIKNFKPLLFLPIAAMFLLLLNHSLLSYSSLLSNYLNYSAPLPYIYGVFFIHSFLILAALIFINQRNKDSVGFAFLLLTSIKMGTCGFLFSKIITSNNPNNIERINFFIIFIIFLTIETLITIRLLNKKQ